MTIQEFAQTQKLKAVVISDFHIRQNSGWFGEMMNPYDFFREVIYPKLNKFNIDFNVQMEPQNPTKDEGGTSTRSELNIFTMFDSEDRPLAYCIHSRNMSNFEQRDFFDLTHTYDLEDMYKYRLKELVNRKNSIEIEE